MNKNQFGKNKNPLPFGVLATEGGEPAAVDRTRVILLTMMAH
jgi:hypothetical protein